MTKGALLRLRAQGLLAILAGLVVLLSVGAQSKRPAPASLSLYERIETRLAKDPDFAAALGHPAPELTSVHWMTGRWIVESRVFKTTMSPERVSTGEAEVVESLGGTWLESRDSYDGKPSDLGFLTFNPVIRKWVSIAIDPTGNSVVLMASSWKGNRLVMVAEGAVIVGERVVLRQTLEKRSDDEYRVLNEERLPSGQWVALDEYVYHRKA